jgi:hypothetical protein
MRRLLLIVLCGSLTVGQSMAQKQKASNPVISVSYDLYSWRQGDGSWSFSVLGNTNRMKTPEEIFDEKEALHGVPRLKQRISHLLRPSRIVWVGNILDKGAPVKGTERLALPPKEIGEDVKRYAETRHIEMIVTK